MASSIFFNGRTTRIPGSYTEVDVTGLAVIGLTSAGIIACIGEAEGGEPDVVNPISNPGKVGRQYRAGDLLEAGSLLFDPSKDANIPGGAQEVKFVKVNPATQSVGTFDGSAVLSVTATSRDYGLFTTRINIEITNGTNVGKAVTVTLDDIEEVFDDIGGVAVFTALYVGTALGADTMLMDLINGTGVSADFTKDEAGLDGDVTAGSEAEAVQVVSDAGGDTTQTITLYGLDGSGDPQTEVLTLNGTTPVVGTATWQADGVLGVLLSAAAVGTLTIASNPTTGTVIFTVTAATLSMGLALVDNLNMSASILTAVAEAATVKEIVAFGFVGQTATGEKFTLNGTTPVPGTVLWSEITVLALGQLEAARTLTVSGEAFALGTSAYPTVSDMAAFINTLGGWTLAIGPNGGPVEIADMDDNASSTVIGGAKDFFGDNAFIIAKINAESALITFVAGPAFTGPPDNTTAPVFLTGGIEGTTTFTEWQSALDKLRDENVNTIVVLTDDAAVHAAVGSHCVFMGGVGRKERDCILGAAAGETLAQVKTRAVELNTRHARLCIQDMIRFNTGGEREQFPPYMHACIPAGMQAGSAVGESLTFKFTNVLDVLGNDTSYNLFDDGEDLIQSGLWVQEKVQGIGFRNLRNITTYLIDDNLAFTEASVNEAVNNTAFNVRTNLESVVGQKGFAGTINAAVSNVIATLGALVDAGVIVTWRNLTVELDQDVMTVDVEVAPVIPVNFVKTTLHLVTASFAAAA